MYTPQSPLFEGWNCQASRVFNGQCDQKWRPGSSQRQAGASGVALLHDAYRYAVRTAQAATVRAGFFSPAVML